MEVIGEIGRTPVPVAESTRHPGEKPLPSVRGHEREGPDQTGESTTPAQGQGRTVGEARGDHEGREPEWALPRPSDLCRPPKAETGGEEVISRDNQRQDGSPSEQRYPTPRQQLLEADKRRRRRLAALARDHIMKLREERDRMAYDWSEEYATRASSAKRSGAGLGTLRAEYVHRYNRLLEHEKQPHSDFFVNLSEDFEDELDFNEDRLADLSQYDQYFEWDEAEYRKQEIAKAKLKKARQQLNVQANPQQVQAGGSAPVAAPAQATVIPAGSPAVTPPQANVPRKAQVGRPAKVAKPKPVPPAAVAATAPKKVTPPKPPVTRGKTRNQPAPTSVAAADIEANAAAPVEVDNDTDGLAELPTDSESETADSEQEEENTQLEGQ